MASRSKLARGGAAVVGASVALMLSAALPAGADPATGSVDKSGWTSGYNVNVGGEHTDIKPSLIGFTLDGDGSKLQMYCVEINTRIDKKHDMVEKAWDSYPNASSPFHANRDKINWVLHHGYPVVATEALTQVLAGAGVEVNDGIDTKEAISATQAAVWHYSDGVILNEEKPVPSGSAAVNEDVLALYKYLTGAANVGIGQTTPALEIAPADQAGEAGKRIGPFTVNTTGEIQKITTDLPEGVKLVDANGAEVTAEQIKNGAELFLDVPAGAAEGSGSFELTASANVDTGRLFVGKNYDKKPTQSLIVATAEKSEMVAKAVANWKAAEVAPTSSSTPAPTTSETTTTAPAPTTETTTPAPQAKNTSGELADTGASIFTPILIGVVLVGAGIGALFFQRHRKRA